MVESSFEKLKLSSARIGVFGGVLWLVFIADWILPVDLRRWGIVPRELGGLWGILFSPFLHGDLSHLLSNFLPLMILLALLLVTQKQGWLIVMQIVLLGGVLLWIFGRPAVHIGASGLIYGLIAYLMAAGFRQGRFGPALAALLVGFLYGGTLLSGVLPSVG
ncbi:MAG: rhomboid family intramembrane serine protease, partial [Pirellula sp.]